MQVAYSFGAGASSALEDRREVAAVGSDVEKRLIKRLFERLSTAARNRDKQSIATMCIESLRREMEGYPQRLEGTDLTIMQTHEPWRDDPSRIFIERLALDFDVLLLNAYKIDGEELWEVCIRFDSEALKTTGLWYFVKRRDELLLADWRFGGNPERSVKRFDLSRLRR